MEVKANNTMMGRGLCDRTLMFDRWIGECTCWFGWTLECYGCGKSGSLFFPYLWDIRFQVSALVYTERRGVGGLVTRKIRHQPVPLCRPVKSTIRMSADAVVLQLMNNDAAWETGESGDRELPSILTIPLMATTSLVHW